MRYRILTTTLALIPLGLVSLGAQTTGVREVTASDRSVIPLNTKIRYTTMVLLPDGEEILDVVCGDRDFWVISATQNIAHVKPAKAGAATNLNPVTSSGNVHSFLLREGTDRNYGARHLKRALHALRVCAGANVDALLTQNRCQLVRDLFVLPRKHAVAPLQDRHLHTEAVENLPEFHSLRTAPDDHQGARQLVELPVEEPVRVAHAVPLARRPVPLAHAPHLFLAGVLDGLVDGPCADALRDEGFGPPPAG